MVKLLTRAGKYTGRYLVLATMTATLVACGGGGGDTVPIDEQDLDGDTIPNGEDLDDDGDGTLDVDDRFTDRDGDGFDDVVFAAVADLDNDNDGLLNKNDPDADGDGFEDVSLDGSREDPAVDLNGDGFDDRDGLEIVVLESFIPPSAAAPCGSEAPRMGINDGSDPDWSENCWVRAYEEKENGDLEGQFANSLYTVGIQRIVYCVAGSSAAGSSYTAFADGRFGNNTEAAVFAFQNSVDTDEDPVSADGEVGRKTWIELQEAITRIGQVSVDASTGIGMHIYGIEYDDAEPNKRCENIPLFYQDISFVDNVPVGGAWHLAKDNAVLPAEGNAVQPERVPFSISSDIGLRL